MGRPRSDDYDDKRQAILDRAAALFARNGYDRTSMAEVAAACGSSKALLYHYYTGKDVLLFDILQAHLQALLDAIRAVPPRADAAAHLRILVAALLDAYSDADNQHKIQINELSRMPPAQQRSLKDMERTMVRVFADAIAAAVPELSGNKNLLKPVTMSLFGMLNWHYMWFSEKGAMSREDYAGLATNLVIEGAQAMIARQPHKLRRRA